MGYTAQKLNKIENLVQIQNWKPDNCPFRLCKVYIANIVFLSEFLYIIYAVVGIYDLYVFFMKPFMFFEDCACFHVLAYFFWSLLIFIIMEHIQNSSLLFLE